MFEWLKNILKTIPEPDKPEIPEAENSGGLPANIDDSIKLFKDLFKDVDTLIVRPFKNAANPEIRFCIINSDGVIDSKLITDDFMRPLIFSESLEPGPGLLSATMDQCIMANEAVATDDMEKIIESVCYGDTILLIDGQSKALILNSKSFPMRSIGEPEGEKTLTGPREGFTEGLMTNLSMLRRRIRTNKLKMRFYKVGNETRTQLCISYIDGIVNQDIVKELYRRLDTIDMDAVLDSNYISEMITEGSFLGFGSAGNTERPDVVASKLLEGRIAIFVDGSPVVITIPFLFIENFQSNEDYYTHPAYATFARFLRIFGFLLTITVPALYIAVVAYHHEIMPDTLMIDIAKERASVPLPAAIEAFIMLLLFDVLREAGVRMPNQVGQALSIVGALVIGQAAVEAKLVAAPMIIVVAFTGITGLLVPKLNNTAIICRYILLFMGSTLGLFGIIVALAVILCEVVNSESFGVPQVTPVNRLSFQDVKDTFVRAPWPAMRTRIGKVTDNLTRKGNTSWKQKN